MHLGACVAVIEKQPGIQIVTQIDLKGQPILLHKPHMALNFILCLD